MDIQPFLLQHSIFTLILLTLFSLMIGSFLNVVIHRIPIMLKREWRAQCLEFLEKAPEPTTTHRFNLWTPASHCPHCHHKIRPWENIPILSYLFLRGRCSNCKKPISFRYPFVECVTAILTVWVYLHFGPNWQAAAAMLLTWILISITLIDFDHQIIPDQISMPTLWLGLMLNYFYIFTTLDSAVIGAIVGYLSLWLVNYLFFTFTRKAGMGHGDFKLFALFGAWFGWQMLPFIILMSSMTGMIVGLTLMLIKKHERGKPIPFGPFLTIAGWIAMMWGADITDAYLSMVIY